MPFKITSRIYNCERTVHCIKHVFDVKFEFRKEFCLVKQEIEEKKGHLPKLLEIQGERKPCWNHAPLKHCKDPKFIILVPWSVKGKFPN